MNNHAKRLCKHLESLDFRRDYAAEEKTKARRVYRHANEPETAIKVFDSMSDTTITTQVKHANKIVGLASSGPNMPTVKDRVKADRRKKKTQQQRDEEARRARAEKAEREYEIRQKVASELRKRREITNLMQPGSGR